MIKLLQVTNSDWTSVLDRGNEKPVGFGLPRSHRQSVDKSNMLMANVNLSVEFGWMVDVIFSIYNE